MVNRDPNTGQWSVADPGTPVGPGTRGVTVRLNPDGTVTIPNGPPRLNDATVVQLPNGELAVVGQVRGWPTAGSAPLLLGPDGNFAFGNVAPVDTAVPYVPSVQVSVGAGGLLQSADVKAKGKPSQQISVVRGEDGQVRLATGNTRVADTAVLPVTRGNGGLALPNGQKGVLAVRDGNRLVVTYHNRTGKPVERPVMMNADGSYHVGPVQATGAASGKSAAVVATALSTAPLVGVYAGMETSVTVSEDATKGEIIAAATGTVASLIGTAGLTMFWNKVKGKKPPGTSTAGRALWTAAISVGAVNGLLFGAVTDDITIGFSVYAYGGVSGLNGLLPGDLKIQSQRVGPNGEVGPAGNWKVNPARVSVWFIKTVAGKGIGVPFLPVGR